MENASKALLIAGAILIAILLIAIGMMVFNSASGVIDTAASGMTDQEKTMHNKKFTIYEGKQSGAVIKELLNLVEANNSNSDNYRISAMYLYKSDGSAWTGGKDTHKNQQGYSMEKAAGNIRPNIKELGIYEVKCIDETDGVGKGDADGLISRIEIYVK